jgi:hypothetical protein
VLQFYRRICVLRATGEALAASCLETGELSRALAEATVAGVPEDSWPARFAAEEKRVADAGLLAELLVPLLAERLHWPASPATAGLSAVLNAFPAKSAVRPDPGAPPPNVADLIEGMLAQERGEHRQRAARRAS